MKPDNITKYGLLEVCELISGTRTKETDGPYFIYGAGTHPKWVADAVAENTLNKDDTRYDVFVLIERCETLEELKNELTEYFDLEEM